MKLLVTLLPSHRKLLLVLQNQSRKVTQKTVNSLLENLVQHTQVLDIKLHRYLINHVRV